jgi:arabinofuranan 3-O-arabinosyltransferase
MRQLSGVNLFLYRQVPGMWLLREPLSKLGPMLVLLYGVMVALSLEGVHDLARRSQGVARGALRTAVAILAIGAVGFTYPMWTGQVVPDQRPTLPSAHVQVPAGWLRLADTLNASTAEGKALVLPLDDFYQMPTTWGYYGVDNVPRGVARTPHDPVPAGLVLRRPPDVCVGGAERADRAAERGPCRRGAAAAVRSASRT